MSQLAPGSLPAATVHRPAVLWWIHAVFLVAAGLTVVGGCCGVVALEGVPGVVAVFSLAAATVTTAVVGPPHVQFGTLRTFRDLAVAVADGRPA